MDLSATVDLDEPISLPDEAKPGRRPGIPVAAAIVPVVSGVVLWTVTGSIIALCFTALGPLMMFASYVDGRRLQRKELARARAEEESSWDDVEAAWAARNRVERAVRLREVPDAAQCLTDSVMRSDEMNGATLVTVGRGDARSSLRVTGGSGERARAFRERTRMVSGVPIVVPLRQGIAVRGVRPVADAVVRALVVQLCLRHSARGLAIRGDALEELGLAGLPHAGVPRPEAMRLHVAVTAEDDARADARIVMLRPDEAVPSGIETVVDCTDPMQARVRTGTETRRCVVEAISRAQAVEAGAEMVESGGTTVELPSRLTLGELAPAPKKVGHLRAVIGADGRSSTMIDLVDDGPHAIVTGVTGSGKSELLVTWVAALAESHTPDQVVFVLADFKGGTAFDPLRELPHVAAVITDLDGDEAQRGVQSLRAELRRREQHLADAGARSIADEKADLPRLVIVVDEFAALLHEHPDLAEVFTDIAARGRALGMHLILGTQRATGVVRDALAANCPLRVTLRVTDAADSRVMIGSDAAALLAGDPASRGLALVRRPSDIEPTVFRVALTQAGDVRRIGLAHADHPRADSPWQPPLPNRISLRELAGEDFGNGNRITISSDADAQRSRELVLGVIDDPERQRRHTWTLHAGHDRGLVIVGGAGAGKSAAVTTLVAQHPDAVNVPDDLEVAWELIDALAEGRLLAPPLLVCDDLDSLLAAFPTEYAQAWAERWERIVRSAGAWGTTVVVTATRLNGPASKIADLIPRRAVLAMPSRSEHLAAGGDTATFVPHRTPGRAIIDGREAQIAVWDRGVSRQGIGAENDSGRIHSTPEDTVSGWAPVSPLTAVIAGRAEATATALSAAWNEAEVMTVHAASTVEGRADESRPLVIVGDAEAWQRAWQLWQRARSEADIVVTPDCATELRTLVGLRGLAPYATPHAGRAWWVHNGGSPQVVVIPALAPRAWR